MKKVKSIFKGLLAIVYFVIATIVIVCLLNRNDYGVVEMFDKNIIMVSESELEGYDKGDLIIVDSPVLSTIKEGDNVFYYEMEFNAGIVNLDKVTASEKVTPKEYTIVVKDNYKFSSNYLLGKESESSSIHTLGTILKVLISKWGFLLLIILPILFAFLYEIYIIIAEVRKEMKEN